MSSNKSHIWNQRKILSRSMCVSNYFFDFFFRPNFSLGSPPGIHEKMIFVKTTILLFIRLCFCLKITFYNFRTCFPLSKSFFDENHFFLYPWGGVGGKIWPKKKVEEILWNTHRSTQNFSLIPNMRFFWWQMGIILAENRQIQVKKATKYASRIVGLEVCWGAHFFRPWKIASFVALEKLYRTGCKLSLEEVSLMR